MSTEKPTECDVCGDSFDSYRGMRVHQSRAGHMEKPWRDEEKLRELYVKKGLSGYDIAERLGCGQNAVYTALDDFGIERRGQSETKMRKLNKKPAFYRTHKRDGYEEWLNEHKGKTAYCRVHRLVAVAEYGVDSVKGKDVHHKNRIPWDNRAENLELHSRSDHSKLHNQERIRNDDGEYVSNGLTAMSEMKNEL